MKGFFDEKDIQMSVLMLFIDFSRCRQQNYPRSPNLFSKFVTFLVNF